MRWFGTVAGGLAALSLTLAGAAAQTPAAQTPTIQTPTAQTPATQSPASRAPARPAAAAPVQKTFLRPALASDAVRLEAALKGEAGGPLKPAAQSRRWHRRLC